MRIRYFSKRDQTWLDFRDADGRRHRVPSGCRTEAEAQRLAPSIIARVLAGPIQDPATPLPAASATVPHRDHTPTLREAFKHTKRTRRDWIESKDKKGLDQKLEQLVRYFGEEFRLSGATRVRVQEWRGDMLQEDGKRAGTKLSHSTINHRLSLLAVLLEAHDLPPHTVKHLSVANGRRQRRTREDELQAVISWCLANHTLKDATTLADMVQVGLGTVARKGELLKIEWTDVYFDLKQVMLRNTKNGQSRMVPCSDVVMRVFERRIQYGNKGPFMGVSKSQLSILWCKARAAMGLEDDHEFVFHVATRHEGASRMGDMGASAFQVKAVMGNSIQAADIYVKPAAETLRELVNSISSRS